MCITRVGKVLRLDGGTAQVELFDGKEMAAVDVSMLEGVAKGAHVEVFGNLALSLLTGAQAKARRAAWREVRKAALMSES